MPHWVIYADDKGKLAHAGSFMFPSQAQTYIDECVHSKFCHIIESKGHRWDTARGEVKFKLSELLKDANYGTKRIFKELE